MTREFKKETGLPFKFLFAIYEGGSGAPADADDCEDYADYIGNPKFPVFADGNGKIAAHTPIDQTMNPQMCALSDEFEILGCLEGHGAYEEALDEIRNHAGL